jgi:hypothetical protein
MKTVTFAIEPFTKSLNRFKDTFKAVHAGRHIEPQKVVGFTCLEAARNFLTHERLAPPHHQEPSSGLDLLNWPS